MPELPEVETIRAQLAPRLTGRRIERAWGHPSAKFHSAVRAAGHTVTGVSRRGKYLLVPLDRRLELVVHLGMTGRLGLAPRGRALDPYVRAWWALDGGEVLALRDVRRFGRVAVVPAGVHDALPTLASQGPEPWDPSLDHDGLWRSLRRSRARVKTQLLSQRPVAGVGNIYADEALWRAGIRPTRRVVGREAAARLLAALRDVLAEGIANGGTTVRDYRALDGEPGRNQATLACYGRAGLPCRRCGRPLARTVVDGRSTTFCSACQR